MAWTCTANLTSGTLLLDTSDRVWWAATAFGSNIAVNSYQDSTHISDNNDVHLCTTHHVHNTKYLSATTLSLDGNSSSNLSTLTQSNTGLKLTFADISAVSTTSGSFYAFDGTTDGNPAGGVNFQAAEGGVSSSWVAANGSGSALGLEDQGSSTSHDFFIATSVSPTSNGNKAFKIKITLTYL